MINKVKDICIVPSCGRYSWAKSMCLMHYKRKNKGTDLEAPVRGTVVKCIIENCNKKPIAKGYCTAHYQRIGTSIPMVSPIRITDCNRGCKIEGCISKHYASGYCEKHNRVLIRILQLESLIEYKGGICEMCGIKYHHTQYDFYHREPEKKSYEIGRKITSLSLEELIVEVDKCDLLCSNCHRLKHFKLKYPNGEF